MKGFFIMDNIKIPDNFPENVIEEIAVNQVAYGVNDKKIAVVKGFGGEMILVNADSKQAVFKAKALGPIFDNTNKIEVYHFDFSSVTDEGNYYIATEKGVSFTFKISKKPLHDVSYALLKMLYYQRCGCGLDEKYAGKYAHGKCHNQTAYLCWDTRFHLPAIHGGWHDAGDYGRYITPANQCICNLVYAHELFGKGVDEDTNIPETGSGMPDILSEAVHELKWMLQMQTPEGGVYHKLCTTNFAGNDMPDYDYSPDNPLVLSQISLQATAGFAAAMAAAYRSYLPYDEDFAKTLLDAAIKAYDYALRVEDRIMIEFKSIAPGGGGDYGDVCAYDEYYWASAELFRSTGDKKYEEKFKHYFEFEFSKTAAGAYNQGCYGSMAYCMCENADPEMKKKVHDILKEYADERKKVGETDAYRVALLDSDYYWGSNAVLTNGLCACVFLAAYDKTDEYDDVLKDSIAYMLGRNILSQSYVTGFGTKKPMHPHHRPSIFDGVDEPVPGMVIGGPNDRPGQRPQNSEGVPSAACFIDWEWNWTTNEIAIYWNTSAFFIFGYLNSKE